MREFESHIQWSTVKEVAAALREKGYQALLAGGCVRDLLMNRVPNDFDLATNATPDEVASLFPKALMVGRAFGVTILPYPGFQLEVATFREDLEYKDGRRPEGVRFSGPEEDARRRDFTVNALFYDLEAGRVIDYVGGEADIRKRVLRTVGDADQRFGEDQLRLMRAVRFAAQLDFMIVPSTFEAIVRLADRVSTVSRERVRDELFKLLKVPSRLSGLELLLSSGLMRALFPALAPRVCSEETAWIRRFEVANGRPLLLSAALALFFFPLASDEAQLKRELRELRLENRLIDGVTFILRNLAAYRDPGSRRRGEIALLLAHAESPGAETVAAILATCENAPKPEEAHRVELLREIAQSALGSERKKPAPLLTGEDLKAHGVKAGPQMGPLLNEAFLLQLEGKIQSRDEALKWLSAQRSSL